jgi:hypothetical protein
LKIRAAASKQRMEKEFKKAAFKQSLVISGNSVEELAQKRKNIEANIRKMNDEEEREIAEE